MTSSVLIAYFSYFISFFYLIYLIDSGSFLSIILALILSFFTFIKFRPKNSNFLFTLKKVFGQKLYRFLAYCLSFLVFIFSLQSLIFIGRLIIHDISYLLVPIIAFVFLFSSLSLGVFVYLTKFD